MNVHKIKPKLLRDTVKVAVIGAGGTGSQVLIHLARLHTAMLALGHPGGLDVTVWDDDIVSKANVGRQAFYDVDIGSSKAATLVTRINRGFGLDWDSRMEKVTDRTTIQSDIIMGCVDNRKARAAIVDSCFWDSYFIDCGNKEETGQVVLGEIRPREQFPNPDRLPHALDLFPDLGNADLDAKDDKPSCSLAEALSEQSLMINTMMASLAVNLLSELFRNGEINHHGYFVNLKAGRVNPLAIDQEVWRRLGYHIEPMPMA